MTLDLKAIRERVSSLPGRGYVVIGDPDQVLEDRRTLLALVDRMRGYVSCKDGCAGCVWEPGGDCRCGRAALLREIDGEGGGR